MRHKNNVLQLSFVADGSNHEVKIKGKIAELQARKSKIVADCEKLHPQGTKLFNHFEQRCIDRQIELLNWIIADNRNA